MASPRRHYGASNPSMIQVLMFDDISPQDLTDHFSQFGTVLDIEPYTEPDSSHAWSTSTHITFNSDSAVTAALWQPSQQIHGYRVQVKRKDSVTSTPCSSSSTPTTTPPSKTVKVSMFNGRLSETQLQGIFTRYGNLTSQITVLEGNPPYAYVNFSDPIDARRACEAEHEKTHHGVQLKARLIQQGTSRNQSGPTLPQQVSNYTSGSAINAQSVQVQTLPHYVHNPTVCQPPQVSPNIPQAVQTLLQYPLTWEPQIQDIEVFELRHVLGAQGQEWNKMLARVQETMPNVRIIKIERIQNKVLYKKYQQNVCDIGNVKHLFHGSGATVPDKIYEGFDSRLSTAGLWGKGTYFAENANFSDRDYSYKVPHSRNHRQIFYASVIIGDTCLMLNEDRSLQRPPLKPGTNQRHDSVSAYHDGGSNVCIVYELYMAYPDYLITYTP